MTFYVKNVKGQCHNDVLTFCKNTFVAIVEPRTQEQKGRL